MEEIKHRFAIGKKMYIFVVAIVLFATVCVCANSYVINVDQVNTYYKRLTINNAKNYASLVDVDFLKELRAVVMSEEYQALRVEAEETEDDSKLIDYLIEKDLWNQYQEEREKMRTYVENMEDLEYLYIVAWGELGTMKDMYLLDADEVPVSETGYWEEREEEFGDLSPDTKTIEPVINNGDWGWLCSGFAAVCDDEGNVVCHVGADVNMELVMTERYSDLGYMILSALAVTIIALAGAFIFVNRAVVKPLKTITADLKKFSPDAGKDYIEAEVIDIPIKQQDEISDIYYAIQAMQKKIVDYINSITTIKLDKAKAEVNIKMKDKEIVEISKEAFKDALTGIGNKNAYVRRVDELNKGIAEGNAEFAIVMMDVNRLKIINDTYGHEAGDAYLKGSCHVICDCFKHSPVYRIGGDEFVAVLSGDDYKNRDERVDAVRDVFEKTFNDESKEPWERYSVSVGMSEFTPEDTSVDNIFRRADRLMYVEKSAFKKKYSSVS